MRRLGALRGPTIGARQAGRLRRGRRVAGVFRSRRGQQACLPSEVEHGDAEQMEAGDGEEAQLAPGPAADGQTPPQALRDLGEVGGERDRTG